MTVQETARSSPGGGARPAPDGADWRIDGARLHGWIDALARIGTDPAGGVSRIAFGEADRAGRAWLEPIMRDVGLAVRIDPAGNIIGELPGAEPGLRPLLFGSHIDSVPNGGNYDGPLGTLAALETIATLRDRGYRNRHPLWVTVWCDEERGLVGSRGFIGVIDAAELERPWPADGPPLGPQIRAIGGDPAALPRYRNEPGSIAGYVELHIEQGATLEERGVTIGIVEGIMGIRSWDVVITGAANHAGTTPMARRRNALLAGAEVALAVDRLVKALPGRQVGTVGQFAVRPGARNIIPGQVRLSIELRDLTLDTLDGLWADIEAAGREIMTRHGTTWEATPRPTNPPALSSPLVRSAIADAAGALGLSTMTLPSGAGHDAQNLARLGPMGMIFVPSVGGISHAPAEFTRPGDVEHGANVLMHTILRLDQAR